MKFLALLTGIFEVPSSNPYDWVICQIGYKRCETKVYAIIFTRLTLWVPNFTYTTNTMI